MMLNNGNNNQPAYNQYQTDSSQSNYEETNAISLNMISSTASSSENVAKEQLQTPLTEPILQQKVC